MEQALEKDDKTALDYAVKRDLLLHTAMAFLQGFPMLNCCLLYTSCAVGITHLAGDTCHMAGLVPKAVEYAVCTQGDKNQQMCIRDRMKTSA